LSTSSLSYSEYQKLVRHYQEDSDNPELHRVWLIYSYSPEYSDIYEVLDNLPIQYEDLLLTSIEGKIKKELAVKKKEEEQAARLALNRKLEEFEGKSSTHQVNKELK
jgi:hypothetical protein